MWYGYYSLVAIRRLSDSSPDSRSFVNLLAKMADSSFLGVLFQNVTMAAIAADRVRIIALTRREKHFVDRAICHTDRRGLSADEHPTFNELTRKIQALEPLVSKYCSMFGMRAPLSPGLPTNWDNIFTYPWVMRTQASEKSSSPKAGRSMG
jgi:hypothetical protein